MPFKTIWTLIAALGVLTQVPGMLESHTFNRCFRDGMRFELDAYSTPPTPFAVERDRQKVIRICRGGTL